METKQTARELLHEARGYLDVLNMLAYKSPIVASLLSEHGVKKLPGNIAAIDAYLATPSESAMEMVRQIRDLESHGGGDYEYYLDATEAAALIEGLQRRVPSALFDEIIKLQPLSYAKLGKAFVKHGIRCEP